MEGDGFLTRAATREEYIRRVALQNEVFNDDIRIEGTILLPYGKGLLEAMEGNGPALVTSQPFRIGSSSTYEEIGQFMQENGFLKAPPFHTWYRLGDGILVSDAHLGNFVSVDGSLIPIDLHLNQLLPTMFAEIGWPST